MSYSQPVLPQPRGCLSEAVIEALGSAPGRVLLPALDGCSVIADDDTQLALWCCYQLHYSSFRGVDDAWEWEPALIAARRVLERAFIDRLVEEIGAPHPVPAPAVAPAFHALANGDGPSLSGHLLEHGTREQIREFLVHRSLYQRKEADPHTWTIPRVAGRVKAAMVSIQYDEYGEGISDAMHAELFATTMRALDLDPAFGAYLDWVPGATLATDNLVTMFGLHREWRAASVGHLTLFEMTSVGPMSRYAKALRRLDIAPSARRFYEVHVAADALHQCVALDEMAAALVEQDPTSSGKLLFGARALVEVERRFAQRLLNSWGVGRSSLLAPLIRERAA